MIGTYLLWLAIVAIGCLAPKIPAAVSPSQQSETAPADRWQLLGPVLTEPGWHLWGASPIQDDKGRIHLFVARWPVAVGWELGWRKHSQIARYVADRPEGPFRFAETLLEGDGEGWDAVGMHNPCIRKARGRYVLFHIANSWEGGRAKHGPNQRIGLRVATSLEGPWQKLAHDGLALAPASWCADSGCGVNNPAFIEAPDGRLLLYFKAKPGATGHVRMGLATAETLEGPWTIQDEPITSNDRGIEDGTAFLWNEKICLLTTDNHGIIERGGGLLWTSDDGRHFDAKPLHGFHPLRVYLKGPVPAEAIFHYGRETKFERPQILMRAGRPAYLYAPSGTALHGEDGTSVHLLRCTPR